MKKIFKIAILVILLIITIYVPVHAETKMTQLRLNVLEANEDYEIYMLLPRKYIMYAIQHDGLNIEYDKANTLKYNVIPSITVDINNIQDETYVENGIEYVQIKLNDLGGDEYLFEIIPEYTNMDMMFRIKSQSKNDLMILTNFRIQNNKCEILYNYKENTLKAENVNNAQIKFDIPWWQIILIIVVVVIIWYFINRRKNI